MSRRATCRLDLDGARAKNKTVFYADDRVFWASRQGKCGCISKGSSRCAKKGFLVVAPRLAYSMETVGNEPVLRFEVRPAGEMPNYPIDETPTPAKGWTFIQSRITDTGSYDQYNRPYLEFLKDVVEANVGSSNFVWDVPHGGAHHSRKANPDAAGHEPRTLPREYGGVVDRARRPA